MHIINYDHTNKELFRSLVADYFINDLQSDIPKEIVHGKLMDVILSQWEKQSIQIALAMEDGKPVGFSIYQIDTPQSDWCKREGWGFIREFYVVRKHRKQGTGTALAAYSEQQLRALGAERLYLTSDEAIGFWQKCGYRNTEEICSNDLPILEKP